MSLEGDRKHCVDAKCKKHGFSYTVSNVFALNGRHLGFAPTGHAFAKIIACSQQSKSIISMSQSNSCASSAHGQFYNSQIFRKSGISRHTGKLVSPLLL